MSEATSPSEPTARAALVCRHPAALRYLQQAFGVVGVSIRQAIGPSFLPRSGKGEFDVVVLDLDIDPTAPPVQLVRAVDEACPGTPVMVIAGLHARQRLIESLAAPTVMSATPKVGSWWVDQGAPPTAAEGPDEQDFAVALKRLTHPTPLPAGPAMYLLHGTAIEERLVGSSEEREAVLAELMEYADRFSFTDEKMRRIEAVADELLLNAVYDAPRAPADPTRARFAGLDRRTPVVLGAQEQVRVRVGCDGRTFVISVCDRFGALARDVVVAHLQRLLEARGPRPRSGGEGGAGLGLVLCFGSSNQLVFHAAPGRFTEVTAALLVGGTNRSAQARGSSLHLFL